MTTTGPPIGDNDLQAYVDGRLDADRRVEVESYLDANPEVAARVAAYQQQNEMLHAVFDPVLQEPVPSELETPVAGRRQWPRYGIAAAWALVWAAGGWILHGLSQPTPSLVVESLPQRAAVAHAVYVPEVVHPVEVTASQQAHLVKWLSKRLDGKVRAPDLRALGYELLGGRLLPADDGAAAQFMYQTERGKRLTLYVRKNLSKNRETAFRYAREGNTGVFYWVDKDFAYALSGELNKKTLLDLAHAAYQQL